MSTTPNVPAADSWLKRLNLTWLHVLLTSTIGRKALMAVTGLSLCGFLVAHLDGNLKLFAGKGVFDEYAEWLHSFHLLPVAEAGLFGLFALHIYLAISTTLQNRSARTSPYAIRQSKLQHDQVLPRPASSWMMISGGIVLGFLLLHIVDMKLEGRSGVAYSESSKFETTIQILADPVSRIVYLVGTIVLGFHLAHGVSSAFQTLGLSHPKYTPLIRAAGIAFAATIAVGFTSLPLLVPVIHQKAVVAGRTPGDPAATAVPPAKAHSR